MRSAAVRRAEAAVRQVRGPQAGGGAHETGSAFGACGGSWGRPSVDAVLSQKRDQQRRTRLWLRPDWGMASPVRGLSDAHLRSDLCCGCTQAGTHVIR